MQIWKERSVLHRQGRYSQRADSVAGASYVLKSEYEIQPLHMIREDAPSMSSDLHLPLTAHSSCGDGAQRDKRL